jgi:hypothetical protein
VLDLPSLVFDDFDLGFLQGRRVLVVGGRLREPALLIEKSVGLRGLALDTDSDRTHRDGPAREDEAAHHQLIDRGPCG